MVIVDTGFWLALANQRDRHHQVAVERMGEIVEPLVTTWPVMTETCHLLLSRLGAASQAKFVQSYAEGAFEVFGLAFEHARRVAELMARYASQPMDLADASLVVLAEDLGHGRILSTDLRDFGTYRFEARAPFENLLLA